MSVFGKVVKGRSKVRCDGCGRISSDPQSGYYLDSKTQKGGNISSKGRECEHDFCSECEAKNTAPEGDCPKCGAQYPRAMPAPAPAPTDARWLSPEAREAIDITNREEEYLQAVIANLRRHATYMDDRLRQRDRQWLIESLLSLDLYEASTAGEREAAEEQYRRYHELGIEPEISEDWMPHIKPNPEIAAKDREIAELRGLLNTPETEDFDKAVPLEAAHQVMRWTAAHDAGKQPEDWFWLLGYLAGKALASLRSGNIEKAKHHCISSAAALRNWHAHIRSGSSAMRPGIAEPKSDAAMKEQA